jgi:carbonic anhydrase/acetyltransferase-like protein (isoleucine patch superfamily)
VTVYRLGDSIPRVSEGVFIAPDATLVGDIELGRDASVWFASVIRADNDLISIGDETNIQDSCVLHTDEGIPMHIGPRVTVGHRAMLHGCTVEEECLVGIGAIVLNHARIRRHSLVGAGALVTEGKEFPERSLILGSPARVARVLTDEEVAQIRDAAAHYVRNARRFRAQLAGV